MSHTSSSDIKDTSGNRLDGQYPNYSSGSLALPYDDFPVSPSVSGATIGAPAEIIFSGQDKGCVCFVDMMNSTIIADKLPAIDVSRYYSVFLKDMQIMIEHFRGEVIKNIGDSLMYYFSFVNATDNESWVDILRDVIDCGITMMAAHEHINIELKAESLPPMNYRISAEYGLIQKATLTTTKKIDLFGPPVNHCAKINSKAPANGMVIGPELYQIIASTSNKGLQERYRFKNIGEHQIGANEKYSIYSVEYDASIDKILNPLTRTSIRFSNLPKE
jgi:class 3 adenylate cyclase